MKKILLLGGSAQQIVAIKTAKKLGYYTILCDYLPDNPGQHYADKFYLVSTTDKEAILKVAEDEKIDGILAYATDPAAPVAAYVAEKLNLPTNPFTAVNTLCNKDLFRNFLKENGFAVPLSKGYSSIDDAIKDCDRFSFPIIVKPVDSSGSKGVSVLKSKENIREALDFAFSYSRAKRVVIEEYIEKDHRYIVGGDIFVLDSKVYLWGLLNCLRDEVNSLVPVGKSYPLDLSSAQIDLVKDTLQKLVSDIGIRFGAMNVELIIDKNGKCYIIDAGPRAGGNMIPDLLNMIFDVDLVEMSVQTAMGVEIKPKEINEKPCFYATYNLHSKENGVLKAIEFDDEIEKHIVKKCLYLSNGDKVSYFDNASKALGIIFMKFDSLQQQKIIENINEHIKIIVK
ncbi:MAG: ATP-grasp domain-containing protein [Oscillospiraceae bacterium]|nr:ATP-grasp domain-containing protein [Candidatus Ruminococcus equi]